MNDILLRRICALISITYAVDKEVVWETFEKTNSIDRTLKIISQIR